MGTIVAAKTVHRGTIDALLIGAGVLFLSIALAVAFVTWTRPAPPVAASTDEVPEVTTDPIQGKIKGVQEELILEEQGGYTWTLIPKATYRISARVLSHRRYSDWQSPVVPLDLALGWGAMSDPAVDEWISWRQSNRWYYYAWTVDSPYNGSDIRDHSANIHIIPANENLANALRLIGDDDLILLEGRLIDINARSENDELWVKTSLTRRDSGRGACEVLYVERFIRDGKEYR